MKVNSIITHLNIRTKLVVAFLAIGLIPVLVLGSLSLTSTKKALQSSAISQVHSSLSAKVERLQDALRLAEKDLRLLSQSPSLITFAEFYPGHVVGRNNLNRMMISTLENFAEDNPLYLQILLLDPNGEQVLRVLREDGALVIKGPDATMNYSKNDFFWKPLDTPRGEIVMTSAVLNGGIGKDDHHTLIYSTAIYDRGRRQKGILMLQFLIKDLARLTRSETDTVGSTYLLDHRGSFLYNVDTDKDQPIKGGFPGMLKEGIYQEILSGKAGLITEEKNRIISFAPIFPGIGGPDNYWVLVTDLSRSTVDAPVKRFLVIFGWMVVALTFIGTLLGITASHHFTHPILELHKGAQLIAKGNFDHRIDVQTNDEIEDLANQFNHMASGLKESRRRLTQLNEDLQMEVEKRTHQLFQAEKMGALGGLSAGIAHEIGNPLASMKTNIQVLQEKLGDQKSHHVFLQRIVKEIDRLGKFFKTFSSFARPGKPHIAPCDIRRIIREVILFIQKEAQAKGITLHVDFHDPLPLVLVDFQRIQQVFLNLFLNAMQSMPEGGKITVTVYLKSAYEEKEETIHKDNLFITITDMGAGIPEALRSRIFEPFFSTKPDGMGLGLSIVHQIVMENNGMITVESSTDQGTTFMIQLEAVRSPAMASKV